MPLGHGAANLGNHVSKNTWILGEKKPLTLLGSLLAGCILILAPLALALWYCDSRYGYIIGIFLGVIIFALGVILSQLFEEGFRKNIAIRFQKWIAPEFPMRGIITAVFLGWFLAMIGVVNLPSMLDTFGWLHGGRITAIPFISTISALAVAPVTILVWYWRHVYKKREREHELLTLATSSLADKDSPSVRITGLYTLQELVETNPAKLIDVMNILCGFIKHRYHEEEERHHAQVASTRTPLQTALKQLSQVRGGSDRQKDDSPKLPKINFGRSPDIREALNIFSNIWQYRFKQEKEYRIAMKFAGKDELDGYRPNLQEINFQQSNLNSLCLREVNFNGSNLQNSDLQKANLQGTHFSKGNLQGACFLEAKLQGARFADAKLQGTRFDNANLLGANLIGADLQGASLHKANLQGVWFPEAKLSGANLCEANLQLAIFEGTDLRGALLGKAKIGGAHFGTSFLHGATSSPCYIMQFSSMASNLPLWRSCFAYRVEEETDISSNMQWTYSEKEIQPTINELTEICKETTDEKIRVSFSTLIWTLQRHIGKPPQLPDPEDSKYCGELTLNMGLDIIKEWPEEMQRKQLEILKERGLIDRP